MLFNFKVCVENCCFSKSVLKTAVFPFICHFGLRKSLKAVKPHKHVLISRF